MSLRASVTSELVLDEVRLPDECSLPKLGGCPDRCRALTKHGLPSCSGRWVPRETACTPPWTTPRAGSKFGKPIAAFQMTQDKLATMTLEYGKGMLLAIHLGRMKDTHSIALAQVSAGKLNNVRGALAIARTTRTILGATE